DEWGIGIGEGFRGPVHVFGEIEEEERLDLVFGVTGITREDGSRGEQGADHRQDQHRRPDAVCAGRRRLRDVAGRSHSEYPGYLPVDGARHLADDWAALAVELSVAILEEVLAEHAEAPRFAGAPDDAGVETHIGGNALIGEFVHVIERVVELQM